MSTWAEFSARCRANVQKIRDTNDDGVYAKLYAEDVQMLLDMIQQAESYYPEGIVPEVTFTWLKNGTVVAKR